MGKPRFGALPSLPLLTTKRVKIYQYRWKFLRFAGFESHPLHHDVRGPGRAGIPAAGSDARKGPQVRIPFDPIEFPPNNVQPNDEGPAKEMAGANLKTGRCKTRDRRGKQISLPLCGIGITIKLRFCRDGVQRAGRLRGEKQTQEVPLRSARPLHDG